MKKLKRSTKVMFWILNIFFLILLCQFFLPQFRRIFWGSNLFLIPVLIFSSAGLALLILSLKEKAKNRLVIFFIVSGASAFSFFVFIILHNLLYALSIVTKNIFLLNYFVEGLQITFFLGAIFVCPTAFLIGSISSIVLLCRTIKR